MGRTVRWVLPLAAVALLLAVVVLLDEQSSPGPSQAPASSSTWDERPGMDLPDAGGEQAVALRARPQTLTATPAPEVADALDTAAESAEEPGPRVVVTGQLVSRDGRPIAGAHVSLTGGGVSRMTTLIERSRLSAVNREVQLGIGRDVTDDDGSFRIEAPLPDPADAEQLPALLDNFLNSHAALLVQHPDFVAGEHPVPALVEGEVDAGTLVLESAGRIAGRVLSADGGRVSGARLAVRRSRQDLAGLGDLMNMTLGSTDQALTSGRTGPDGGFELGGLREDTYDLYIHGKGHPRFVLRNVTVEAGLSAQLGDLVLARGSSLSGVVLDGRGDPVPGLSVKAKRRSASGVDGLGELSMRLLVGGVDLRSETDDEGRFEFRGISDGTYDVSAGGRRSAWSQTKLKNVLHGTLDLELVVQHLGELLISVRGRAGGLPLTEAVVEATRREDDWELKIVSGDELAKRLAAARPPGTAGTASPDQGLAADAGWTKHGGVSLVLCAGRKGTDVVVRAEGYATTLFQAPPVLDGERVEHTVLLTPESHVEGVVRDDRGDPVPGAEVRAVQGTDDPGGRGLAGLQKWSSTRKMSDDGTLKTADGTAIEPIQATSDDRGRFRLTGLGAGDWSLVASADDHVPSEPKLLSLLESQPLNDVDLVVSAGGHVAGRVTEASGQPVVGARLNVAAVQQSNILSSGSEAMEERMILALGASLGFGSAGSRSVKTDADGRYEARGLRPGDYTVTLRKRSASGLSLNLGTLLGAPPPSDGRTQTVRIVARETVHADFARSRRGGLSVRVTVGGRPVGGARVALNDSSNSLFGLDLSMGGRMERTDRDGMARFDDVETGDYKLSASVPGAAHMERAEVTMSDGDELHVDLAFGGTTLLGRVVDELSGDPAAGVVVHLERVVPEDAPSSGGFLSGLLDSSNVNIRINVDGQSTRSSGGAGLFGLTAETVTSAENGRFELRALSPGRWDISTQAGRWIPGDPQRILIQETQAPETVTLHVRLGATLRGQVIEGATEDPLNGARIVLRSPEGDEVLTTRSDQGTYLLEGVPPGDYILVVKSNISRNPDRARREVHVGSGAPNLTVHLITLD